MPSIFSVCSNGDWKGSGEGFIILIQSQREDKYKPFFSSWPCNTKPLGDFHKDGMNVAFNAKKQLQKMNSKAHHYRPIFTNKKAQQELWDKDRLVFWRCS